MPRIKKPPSRPISPAVQATDLLVCKRHLHALQTVAFQKFWDISSWVSGKLQFLLHVSTRHAKV